jgi:hypothetical protein
MSAPDNEFSLEGIHQRTDFAHANRESGRERSYLMKVVFKTRRLEANLPSLRLVTSKLAKVLVNNVH